MSKVVDIEKLKPSLEPLLTEETSVSTIESIMGIAEDYDETSVQNRIDEAVKAAKEEEAKSYSQKLHDMFFKGGTSTEQGGASGEGNSADQQTDPEIKGKREVVDIFTEI